ncbi:hypothetical protein [Nocardia nova]|uniref:hypothetical protein n=1 Tax=Nocardia nova TaxID=37330 RepID=UPI0027382D80|nr:hypothetical protein [Nocardia nova]
MTTMPDNAASDDRASGASDDHLKEPPPDWAPVEPLPSSEMFLAAFAGFTPVAAQDILEPAAELVECQRQDRRAVGALRDPEADAEELKSAAAELILARSDIEMLTMVIDDAIADRLLQRRNRRTFDPLLTSPVDAMPQVVVHTESVGAIAARMADLWVSVTAKADLLEELPHAYQLCELCVAYDSLAAEIEAGRRLPPGL